MVSIFLTTGTVFQLAAAVANSQDILLGISYGPVPLKSQTGASALPEDDFFGDQAVPMWGRGGRGDLLHIKNLGANTVRLYGNNPANQHTNFLDEAHMLGLKVIPGMSDHPFYQEVTNNCRWNTDFDCFTQVRDLYRQNLLNGFLTPDRKYHPALRYMNVLNEPDLKIPPTADIGDELETKQMARAVVSALDGMLEAEKDLGVTGATLNFTATFSYAVCRSCGNFSGRPALGQIWRLHDAIYNPDSYNYTPRNDLVEAYETRFVHSYNTANPARDLKPQFLDTYTEHFPSTPVYIGEYHSVFWKQTEDLALIMKVAREHPLFMGIAYFQFQVAYWKTGSEMDFGIFGFGNRIIAEMDFFNSDYDVWCLDPVVSRLDGESLADIVASEYGVGSFDATTLCAANPLGVPLNQTGFDSILEQKSPSQLSRFIQRVAEKMGATVKDDAKSKASLIGFAEEILYGKARKRWLFADLAAGIGSRPEWLEFDESARCVANRYVPPDVVGAAIGWACSEAKTFNCSDVPVDCNYTYRIGDWVFSRYYRELAGEASPLVSCDFGGAGTFASSKLYSRWTGASMCVVEDPDDSDGPDASDDADEEDVSSVVDPSNVTRNTSDPLSTSTTTSTTVPKRLRRR